MSDLRNHDHIRRAFAQMRKGNVAWIKIGPKYHQNIYHQFCKKSHLDPNVKLGEYIYMKLYVD